MKFVDHVKNIEKLSKELTRRAKDVLGSLGFSMRRYEEIKGCLTGRKIP